MPDNFDGNPIPSPIPVTVAGGTDGTNIQALRLTSDGDVKIGAGTAAIGKLAANSGVDIGDVDVTSTVPPTPSAAAGVASSHYHPITQVTTASVKGSAGNVFKIRVTNENAAARFIQLHNKATAPAATDVPVLSWKIPTGTATVPGYIEFEFKFARQFSTGIGVAISTTQATFTDSATATEHEIFVEYV